MVWSLHGRIRQEKILLFKQYAENRKTPSEVGALRFSINPIIFESVESAVAESGVFQQPL